MSKQVGAACPSCHEQPCAEFALKDQQPRWTCNFCGAGGALFGEFSGRAPPAPAKPQTTRRHWTDRP